MNIKMTKDRYALLFLVLIVGIVNFTTMPGEFYSGDSYAIKVESIHWLREGKFGFKPSEKKKYHIS